MVGANKVFDLRLFVHTPRQGAGLRHAALSWGLALLVPMGNKRVRRMKTGQTLFHEIEVFENGDMCARCKDKRPLTDQDWQDVHKWVDSASGITAKDVLRLFPGAKVIQEQ